MQLRSECVFGGREVRVNAIEMKLLEHEAKFDPLDSTKDSEISKSSSSKGLICVLWGFMVTIVRIILQIPPPPVPKNSSHAYASLELTMYEFEQPRQVKMDSEGCGQHDIYFEFSGQHEGSSINPAISSI